MTFPWMLYCRRRLECGSAVALALAGAVVACGPEFPNSYYAMPESELLAAPEGFFAAEIARLEIAPPALRAVPADRDNPRATTLEIDVADVRRGLEERGFNRARVQQLLWNYETARRRVENVAAARDATDEQRAAASGPVDPLDDGRALDDLLAGVPAEFALYLRGAAAWHRGDLTTARQHWMAVLALPETERKRRSTWAAFMLGRVWHKQAAAVADREPIAERRQAAQAFRQARQLALSGLPDPLGLATSSLGWEARVALDADDAATALTLYLEQHAAGDPTAIQSLRITAARILALPSADLAAFATNPVGRRVVTAYLISRTGGTLSYEGTGSQELARAGEWAAALERAGVRAAREADRMAWLAYEAGQFALATQWVRLAADDSAEANWIRAKLALRAGEVADGEAFLRRALASPTLAEPHRKRVSAELSRVCLARDDFPGALAACLAGGHWEDAAFVAERVMTTAELRQFVDARPIPVAAVRSQAEDVAWAVDLEVALRELLARRLTREGRVEMAAAYFSGEKRIWFEGYVWDVRVGFDLTQPAPERGRAFWRAAQCARAHGMELLGTEMDPDWSMWGGSFAGESAAQRRAELRLTGGVLAPTTAELERLKVQTVPEKRFHYRYRAAELAWWAASLLPNDDAETAQILATAGGWLKARDPQAAQPFYQALVIRCGNTPLGQAAARKRWFPVERSEQ
ncbi:hypothetical protein [Horticoccus sp. 23ND18S-11]|uniref:hypothetical protein n=1 Tax=Horticoccus sp. 23ND18S-11 TaxID=3391832 RepID=UPI0039C94CBD